MLPSFPIEYITSFFLLSERQAGGVDAVASLERPSRLFFRSLRTDADPTLQKLLARRARPLNDGASPAEKWGNIMNGCVVDFIDISLPGGLFFLPAYDLRNPLLL